MHKIKKFFICTMLLLIAGIPPYLSALELKRVILSTNGDPKYIQFWPVVAPLWQAMGLRPTLALIAEEDCPIDTSLGDVIQFAPIPGIPESLQAQVIRIYLPMLFPDDGCLISDIDMLPISKAYFIDGAAHCPDESFLVYRDLAYGEDYPRYPMCYLAAKGRVFDSAFHLSKYRDAAHFIAHWAGWGYGWNTDELLVYPFLKEWEENGGNVQRLGHTVGPRIDRLYWPKSLNYIDVSQYIDCHCPRPYSEHRELIDQLCKAILKHIHRAI
jgi:hypothetical protein